MILAAKALAFVRGRDYALPEDVRDLALDVLRHRVVLSYEALADDVSADDILSAVLATIPLPDVPLHERRPRPDPRRSPRPRRLSAVLRRLEWRVLRRLDGLLQGDYRTLFHGVGIDFADLREYEPGDDVRHIDWNVTARMDSPFVRTYLEDRELTAWLLLDRSPSMGFGPTDRPKEPVLIELATALARLLTRGGNRVGAILYNNDVERTIPPQNGRNQVLRLTRDLLQPAAPSARPPTLTGLIHAAARHHQAPLADLPRLGLHQRAGLGAAAGAAHRTPRGRRHSPGRSERARSPRCRVIVVEDAETGEQLSVDTSDPEFRRRFHEWRRRGRTLARHGAASGRPPVRGVDRGRPGAGARAHRRVAAAAAPLMSFLWPGSLCSLLAARCSCRVRSLARRDSSGRPSWRRRASSPRRARRRRAASSRAVALFLAASRLPPRPRAAGDHRGLRAWRAPSILAFDVSTA